jgi:hypothetical protein
MVAYRSILIKKLTSATIVFGWVILLSKTVSAPTRNIEYYPPMKKLCGDNHAFSFDNRRSAMNLFLWLRKEF